MEVFKTASFHIIKQCNMKCKFCYATFNDSIAENQMKIEDAYVILNKLKKAGLEKITFAGGEPMLYKDLDLAIIYAKSIGLTTSIITNGSRIKESWLIKMIPYLDWIGLSVDSISHKTNELTGRKDKMTHDYYVIVDLIKKYNYKLKINTVVNIHNQDEKLVDFIKYTETKRWKIFDTLKVEGQNDKEFESIKSTKFNQFLKNNDHNSMVVEDNDLMTGSYLLIDPKGRLFENSKGKHTYSDKLIDNTIEKCLSQINLNKEKFIKRGGIYKWQ